MRYKLLKMKFLKGVHFGNGALLDNDYMLYADTIFSALCIEALYSVGQEGIDRLVNAVMDDEVVISDAFPYLNNDCYLPKPIMEMNSLKDNVGNDKKAAKKLKYIPIDLIEDYFSGELSYEDENEIFKNLGTKDVRTRISMREKEEALPYSVGIFNFSREAGLYICLGTSNDNIEQYIIDLFVSLQYSGIGGKRNSGLGKFELVIEDMPQILQKMIENKNASKNILLSCALPFEDNMEEALKGATYQVIKRSGYVQSNNYSDTYRKKKDQYLIKSGSCFEKQFKGKLYDISNGGNHPVYKYAKPLFMGVNI